MDWTLVGEASALLSALVWAFAVVLFRKSGETVPPLALNLFKNVLALVLLVATLLLAPGGAGRTLGLGGRDLGLLAVSGVLGIAVSDTLFFAGLNRVGVGVAAVVNCLYAPFVILFAHLLLGEALAPRQWLGTGLVLAAVLVASAQAPSPGRPAQPIALGAALVAAAMATTAFAIVLVKPLLVARDVPVLWAAAIRMAAGTAVLASLVLLPSRRDELARAFRPARDWRYTIPGSFLGGYLSMILWVAGFKHARASVAGVLNQTTTVFAFVFGVWFLGEPWTARKALALGLALAGVALVTLR